jgi:DNA-directed RNA polymerase subunit RPC12/RpoP
MKQKTALYCHECDNDFVSELDMSLNGNHVITCPYCSHRHYRVIENGRVTGTRWRSSMPSYYVTGSTVSVSYSSSTSVSYYTSNSWLNTTYATGTSTY